MACSSRGARLRGKGRNQGVCWMPLVAPKALMPQAGRVSHHSPVRATLQRDWQRLRSGSPHRPGRLDQPRCLHATHSGGWRWWAAFPAAHPLRRWKPLPSPLTTWFPSLAALAAGRQFEGSRGAHQAPSQAEAVGGDARGDCAGVPQPHLLLQPPLSLTSQWLPPALRRCNQTVAYLGPLLPAPVTL